MSLIVSKVAPRNWYLLDCSISYELLDTFVRLAEEQAVECSEKYRVGVEHIEEDPYANDDDLRGDFAYAIEHYKGLLGSDWDLKQLFESYFPSLQRRSALLTLVGILESELNKLCQLFKESYNLKLELKDLNGTGFYRATNFLEKVAGINVNREHILWLEIKKYTEAKKLLCS